MDNKFFGRRIELIFEEKTIKYPGLEIEFEIDFSDTDEGNAGFIRVYNLAKNTVEKLNKGKYFKLKAGYKDYKGVILPGVIEKARTEWQGVDKVTTLIVGDETEKWLQSTINRTWKSGKKASEIAPDIVEATGLEIGEVDIVNDITYEKGKTFSTTCREALKEIATDTNTKLHVSRGRVFLRPPQKSENQAILLNSKSGLIASPEIGEDEEDEEFYRVKSLLNYKISTDSLLRIESQTVEADFRVREGKHISDGDDFATEVEVEKI